MGWFSDALGGIPGISEISKFGSQFDDTVTRKISQEVGNGWKDAAISVMLGPLAPVYIGGRAMQAQQNKVNRQMLSAFEMLKPPSMPVLQAAKAPATQRNASTGVSAGASGNPYSTILTTPSGVLPSSTLLGKSLLLGQ